MSDCLFCKIARGELATEFVWQDDEFVAFRDIDPKAPQHVLVIPRRHVDSLAGFEGSDPAALGRFLLAALAVARQLDLLAPERGFRLVANTGPEGGQTVPHAHLHLLGGRRLHWTPA
jgi:histidine triad (HIT) family protein